MSSSMPIPTPTSSAGTSHDHNLRNRVRRHRRSSSNAVGSVSDSSPPLSTAASPSLAACTPATTSSVSSSCCCPGSPSQSLSLSPAARQQKMLHQRRPSLLSSAISKQEAHVINIGDPDGPPRLISYLSSSQGFTWNPEIFVPSYVDCDYTPLENRREPVHEIFLSDEEINNMYPK